MPSDLVVTIIPNWNLKDDLGECLNSLMVSTYQNNQIVVVDNGSTDGSPQYIANNFPNVHLICLKVNTGYATALNAGIEYAMTLQAKYVFALNNDTVVDLKAIEFLVQAIDKDPQIGIAAPKILYYQNPEIIYSLGDKKIRFLPVPLSIGRRHQDNSHYSGIMEYDYVTGCAMMIRTSLFQQIGMFDPTYFMYYEDSDFCRRVRDQFYRIICVGDAKVLHKASLSSTKEKPFITQIRARNRIRFYRRFPHGPHPALTYLVIIFMAFWRSFEYIIHSEAYLMKYYLKGIIQGFKEAVPLNSKIDHPRGDSMDRI